MLQPVSLGHHRCICPGLSLDERGVPLGQQLVILFPDLRAVTAFVATASAEMSLERILASLEIFGTQTPLGLKQWLVRFDVQDSLSADPFAQWARLHRGRVFTGTQSHFVPYRDQNAPTGYDLMEASSVVRGAAGIVIYAHAGMEERQLKNQESLFSIALNLSLIPLSVTEQKAQREQRAAFLVPQALSEHFFKYLQRLKVEGEVLPVFSETKELFSQPVRQFFLVSCNNVPRSLFLLMKEVPGVEVLIPALDNVFIAWPNRHPFVLENLAPLFDEDLLYVFSKNSDRAYLFRLFGRATKLQHLTKLSFKTAKVHCDEPDVSKSSPLVPIGVPTQLIKSSLATPQRVDAVFIEKQKLSWLQSLLYRLPQHLLEESRALLTEEGIFILTPDGGSEWALGNYFYAIGSNMFMPWGFDWTPKISATHLREAIGGDVNDLCFVRGDETLVRLEQASFVPLSKAALAPWTVEDLEMALLRNTRQEETELVHAPQKRFVLWRGMSWKEPEKQLPVNTTTGPREKNG